ncbi:MAG: hypothetical protein V4498_01370 [candidate division FCPU426 bacterium]
MTVGLLLFVPQIRQTARELILAPGELLSLLKGEHAGEWMSEGGGQYILPPEVLEGLALLKQAGVRSYRLEGSFKSDTILYQRMTEATVMLPARHDLSSTTLLMLKSDWAKQPPTCASPLVLEGANVVLARCP